MFMLTSAETYDHSGQKAFDTRYCMRPSSMSIDAVSINLLPWSRRFYVHSFNSDVGAPEAFTATQVNHLIRS